MRFMRYRKGVLRVRLQGPQRGGIQRGGSLFASHRLRESHQFSEWHRYF